MPSDSSWEKGIAPLAIKVVATGMCSTSAKLTSDADAPARIMPLPARMMGHFASEMMCAACSILKSGGVDV